MKIFLIKLSLFLIFTGSNFLCIAQYSEEILKLAYIDFLPKYQEKVMAGQVSSYDRTCGNDDGWSGKYSYIRKENGNLVIADLKGPGIIQRIWTPTPNNDTIQFFFDEESIPRIELKFIDLFTGNRYPFIKPVVGNEVGGYYNYLPIPYKNSLKIVLKGKLMQYIQVQYVETEADRVNESFPENFSDLQRDALNKVVGFWKSKGKNVLNEIPESTEMWQKTTKHFSLKPGDSTPIFEINRGGRIAGIEITPGINLNKKFKDLILRAWWDDETVPAINSPMCDFFGYAFGNPSVKSLLLGVNENRHYCYLPMPFDKKAIFELELLKNEINILEEIPVTITIYYSYKKRLKEEGKLYVEWRREIPEKGEPYLLLKKSGRGHHVGTLLQSQGLNPGMTRFFEGDEQCYIDGELRLHGTGSEDYFNGGWYAVPDRWDQSFSLPVHGALNYSLPLARTGGYRFLIADKLSFENNYFLTIQHGAENNNIPVDYASVVFYYCDTPPDSNHFYNKDLLRQIESPKLMEYHVQLLPIKALSLGSGLSHTNLIIDNNRWGYDVFKLESPVSYAPYGGFAKFELEVPYYGPYKLYISYLKGPECGSFDINQRQVPIKTDISGYSPKYLIVEKEYIGDIDVEKGTNTITFMLKDKPENEETNTLLLHRIYLEKIE